MTKQMSYFPEIRKRAVHCIWRVFFMNHRRVSGAVSFRILLVNPPIGAGNRLVQS